ncbi:MAG: hypothetical protein WCF84_04490 [Anaerolineae bacterium]
MFKQIVAQLSRRRILQAVALAACLLLGFIVLFGDPDIRPGVGPHDSVAENKEEETGALDYFRYRHMQLEDENGVVRPGALWEAVQQREQIAARQRAAGVAGVGPGFWTGLGPGNIGGRVRAIIPIDANTILLGSVGGGIWKTTDGGASWALINDTMANLAIGSMALDPTSSGQTLYAGTGEGFFNADAIQGAGIFKSTDGGNTWTQLASTAPATTTQFQYVNRLAISPDGSTLLAATNAGIMSSPDGGTSWTQTFATGGMLDVVFDPNNSLNAIASTGMTMQCSSCTVPAYYSTDGGATWTPATGLPTVFSFPAGRVEVTYAAAASGVVYASVDNSTSNSGQIYRSVNGGHSYTQVNSGNAYLGGQGWYDNVIWADPTDATGSKLVVGGIDLWRGTYSSGSVTLTHISNWQLAPSSPHADNHAIVSAPGFSGSNPRVYIGNDGGIYTTANIYTAGTPSLTSGWSSLNHTLFITQFYGASGNDSSNVVYGGTQDNGTLKYTPPNGQNTWTAAFGGDGGFSAADPTDSNYFYGEYVYLQIHRSSDGGASAGYIYGGGGLGCNGITDAGSNALFIAPFMLDPNNSNTMLAGGLSLWQSTNVKATTPCWNAIKSPVTGNPKISAIAVATGNSSIIWVGYKTGRVEMTTNGGTTWNQIGAGTLPARMVERIVIDPTNSNVVYVTFGGFSTSNIWKTTTGGTAWTNIMGSLPAAPVYSLAINPSNSSWVYAGTEVGLFASEDGGTTWNIPNSALHGDGPANVAVFDLQWMGSRLIAATHGRGVFDADTTQAGTNTPTPTPTITDTPTITPTPSNTSTPTITPTPTNTATPLPTLTVTSTPPPNAVVESDSPLIQYDGWKGVQNANANGGSYRTSNTTANKVVFKFTGASIRWVTMTGPDQGKATVTIGATTYTVDLYSATQQWNVNKTYSGLTSGAHTITIKVSGTKNAASTGTNVAVDAFVVNNGTPLQENSPLIRYDNWYGVTTVSASGGSYRYNRTLKSFAQITFTGSSINWITNKGPSYGKAIVTIDGISKGTFDLYRAAAQWQVAIPFTNLGAGTHVLQVKPQGTKNAAATSANVVVDAFSGPIIPSSIVPAGTDTPDMQDMPDDPDNSDLTSAAQSSDWPYWLLPFGALAAWLVLRKV